MNGKAFDYTAYNGVKIPAVGFGTWKLRDGEKVYNAVTHAIKSGYRHIDTAAAYYNEAGVGDAVRDCGIPREQLFITTKLWNTEQGYDSTLRAFDESMAKLKIDYLDMYLLHWPKTYVYRDEYPKRIQDTWRAFEELYDAGKIKVIGVCNFFEHHINDLMQTARILPMVDQLEVHPGYCQKETVEYCRGRDMIVEAWSPFASGKMFLNDGVFAAMTEKYGKTAAQITMRWHIQNGLLPLPKSKTPSRIEENIDIFDFELEKTDMDLLDGLPETDFSGFHPDDPGFLKEIG